MTPSAGATGDERRPVDVAAFIGPYAFRHLPHPDPDVLVRVLEREGLAGAWVGHLPSVHHRDPAPGNAELYKLLGPFAPVLRPVPAVRPDWPRWEHALDDAVARGAPAVRAYPPQWGLGAEDPRLHALVHACGERGLVLVLTVRFEDLRQRDALDVAGDLAAGTVRRLARVSSRTGIVVTSAGREFIEEVHWGLTADEQSRVWYDIPWIWGPPEDHLAHLFRTVGASRFLYGTAWPLRLTQAPAANLALLPDDVRQLTMAHADDVAAAARGAASR